MFVKESYIKQIGPKKFRVYSERGKNMGTYSSQAAAKKRLRDIEYFKHKNSADDNHYFSRGGEGDIPPFFRKNLDYGERDKVLKKKLSKLKSVKTALQNLGLKKEASAIKNNIKSLLLNAFLTLTVFGSGIYLANQSLESGKLKEIVADFSLEESPNLSQKKAEFNLGTPAENIIQNLYPDIPTEDKKDIILEFLKEYNPNLNFESGLLELRQQDLFFKYTHRAEVAYPDLKNIMDRFTKRLASGYDPSEVGKVGEMSMSPDGLDFIMTGEGFSDVIYNDNSAYSWPSDKNNSAAKGHWMIGYGHQLQPDELETGLIEISPSEKVKWTDGITRDQGLKIKTKDLVRNSILKAGLDPEEEITKGMYDSFTDISYNLGPKRLARILENSKDSSGKFNMDIFSKELANWTGVSDPAKKKGIQIRRISQILLARGILLPEDPEHNKQLLYTYNVNMSTPNKDIIQKYLKYFGNTNKIKESDVAQILKKVSNTPDLDSKNFVEILKSHKFSR